MIALGGPLLKLNGLGTNVDVFSLFYVLSVSFAFVFTKSNCKSDVHSDLLWDPLSPYPVVNSGSFPQV